MGITQIWDYINEVFRRLRGDASGRAVTLPEGQYLAVPGVLVDEDYHHLTLTVDKKLRVDDPTTQAAVAAVEAKVDDIEVKLDTPANFMADLTTLENRLSAARAGYLDQLDFALQEAIAAIPTVMVGTDGAALAASWTAALATALAGYTAARAVYLDQLDFNLQEAIAALQTDLDNPGQYKADLSTLETRLSAVRAGYLDQLDFALQEAIAAIPTVMVGTDGAALATSWTAALATALGNYTAGRAAYLDQLDFALQEAIAALQTDLDAPAQYKADLSTLETRLSAVRAGYLDQLDFDLQAKLVEIDGEVEGLGGAAMRGTDNAATAAKLEDAMQKATGPAYNQDTDSQEAIREAIDTIVGGYGIGSKMFMDIQIGATRPPEVNTTTTGAGSVTFGVAGASLVPGVSAGDDASLYLYNLAVVLGGATSGVLKLEFLLCINDPPAQTNIAIGVCASTDAEDVTNVAYFDPTAGNVRVDAATSAVVYPTMNDWAHWFRVEIDLDAGETRFYIDDVLEATIPSVPTLDEEMGVITTSTGAGAETVRVQCMRFSWETS